MANGAVWDVPQAIERMQDLARQRVWFIEEPSAPRRAGGTDDAASPDDVLGA